MAEVEYNTVAEVAKLFRVSKMTVYRMVREGGIGYVEFGPRNIRIPVSEVARLQQTKNNWENALS